MSETAFGELAIQDEGEVHNSTAPLELALAIAITLAGLLVWPFLIVGVLLLIHSLYSWISEDVALWEKRPATPAEEWGHASWAMVWIIVTEAILFASFFAFWFWAKWHTLYWDDAVGGMWPAAGVEHNMALVTVNTGILLSSGYTAHLALDALKKGEERTSRRNLIITVVLGALFLLIQIYEYLQAGFLWSDHAYGTAFFSLTGLHGLHVLIGLVCLSVMTVFISKGICIMERHDTYRAITWYWHFVDLVWVLLYLIVYWEVI